MQQIIYEAADKDKNLIALSDLYTLHCTFNLMLQKLLETKNLFGLKSERVSLFVVH